MMSTKTVEQNRKRAVELAERSEGADSKSGQVVREHTDFCAGHLMMIQCTKAQQSWWVWTLCTERGIIVFDEHSKLLDHLAGAGQSLVRQHPLSLVLGNVSGVLALLLSFTLCVLLLMGRPVQTELWAALTTLLAFYFGSRSSESVV